MWPLPAADQVRQAEARHAHQAEHVRLDHLALVDLARLPDGVAAAGEPGVVDEDVDARRDRPVPPRRTAALLAGSVTSRLPSRREPVCTRAPASASARAVAAPIPLEAPVTIARLPSRAAIGVSLPAPGLTAA